MQEIMQKDTQNRPMPNEAQVGFLLWKIIMKENTLPIVLEMVSLFSTTANVFIHFRMNVL